MRVIFSNIWNHTKYVWFALVMWAGLSACVCLPDEGELPKAAEELSNRRLVETLNSLVKQLNTDMTQGALPPLGRAAMLSVTHTASFPDMFPTVVEQMVVSSLVDQKKTTLIYCDVCRQKKNVRTGFIYREALHDRVEVEAEAEKLKLNSWLSATVYFQHKTLVLSVSAFESLTQKFLWSKTYSASTLPPLVLDEKPRKERSDLAIAAGLGKFSMPNIHGTTNMVAANFRIGERFNLGRSEISGSYSFVAAPELIVKSYPGSEEDLEGETTSDPIRDSDKRQLQPFKSAQLIFVDYRQFFGCEECFPNRFDFGAHASTGLVAAKGYMTLGVRSGAFMTFANHFYVESGALYNLPTTISVQKIPRIVKVKGGIGWDVSLGVRF